MTIDVFVLQIMISGEIQAVNIGNTRLVPGFPQGSNSLEKASAQAGHLRVYPHVLQHELASGFPFEFYYLMIFLVYRDLIDSRIKL